MPPPPNTNNYARQTNHDPDATWTSTFKPLWNRTMSDHILFDAIAFDDLRGELSIQLMSTFSNRLAETIPISPHTKKPFSPDTLKKSLMACIWKLKSKFGTLLRADDPPLFPDADITAWCNQIKNSNRRSLMEGEDESNLFKSTFPIPTSHGPRTILLPEHDIPNAQLRPASRQIDLVHLSQSLFQKGRFDELLKLLLTFRCIGRGGEVKFLSYKRMYFDSFFGCVFTQWFQRKNLISTPSGWTVSYDNPSACIFLAFGCYWACNNGLQRLNPGEANTPQSRKSAYVFQDLHDMQDKNVASNITTIIRGEIPQPLRQFYTGKSLRYGAMSDLTWTTGVQPEESVALGGWSTASNADWYTWTYICAIVPPIAYLAGYPNPRLIPRFPDKTALFCLDHDHRIDDNTWNIFLLYLFPNSLPEFMPGPSRLRGFMDTVACVMIMHFTHFFQRHGGGHKFTHVLANTLNRCGTVNSMSEGYSKLLIWSEALSTDFRRRNSQSPVGEAANGTAPLQRQQELHRLSQSVSNLMTGINDIHNATQLHQQRQAQLTSHVSNLTTQNQQLLEQQEQILRNQTQLLSLLQSSQQSRVGTAAAPVTPGTSLTNNRTQPPVTPQATNPPGTAGMPPAVNPNRARTPAPSPTPAPAPPPAHAPPQAHLSTIFNKAVANANTRQRGKFEKSETLVAMLDKMYHEGESGRGPFISMRTAGPALSDHKTWVHQYIFHARQKADSKIERALKFLDAVWTKHERDQIIYMEKPFLEASRLHHLVVERAREILHLLKADMPRSTKPTHHLKTAIQGFGNNVQKTIIAQKLDDYVPDWNSDGGIAADETLTQLAESRRMQITHSR